MRNDVVAGSNGSTLGSSMRWRDNVVFGNNDQESYAEVVLDLGDIDGVEMISLQETPLLPTVDPAEPPPRRQMPIRRRVPTDHHQERRRDSSSELTVARALQGLRFINQDWAAVEGRLEDWIRDPQAVKPPDNLIPSSVFGKLIGIQDDLFAKEVFDTLARRARMNQVSTITHEELRGFWEQLTQEGFDGRLYLFFDLLDRDANGRITEHELKEFIQSSASAFKLNAIHKQAAVYASLLMEQIDHHDLGYIEVFQLKELLLQWSGRSSTVTELLKLFRTQEANPLKMWLNKVLDNWKRIWVISLWLTVCAALFTWKFIQYRRRYVFQVLGYCVCVAKGGAEIAKFNMALILLPVCRNTITCLRTHTNLGRIIPFNDEIKFHQVVAAGAAVGIGLHVIAHTTCNFPRLLHASKQAYAPLAAYFGEHKPPNYWWFLKGTEGWTGIVMVVLMVIAYTLAQPCLRLVKTNNDNPPPLLKRLTGFNAFWYSHHLFVFVYVLLIVHGNHLYLQHQWYQKTTWMYIAVPMVVYGCERFIRKFRSNHKPVNILQGLVHPDGKKKVLGLHLSKPDGFTYTSGQYIFVKCHQVSQFEWHPFSLTSAPGDDYISVHIQASGDWTSNLIKLFSQQTPPTGGHIVKIDGPYGAPAQDYNKYKVLLLVGLGIGATPMISIMKDIASQLRQEKGASHVTKAYLYWSTDDQSSFDLFRAGMNEAIEHDDGAGVIEIHNHCTSVKEVDEARTTFITALQNLYYARYGLDVVSGTRVRAHFARPNWPAVLHRIAAYNPAQRVGVFFCGQPDAARELRQVAQELSTTTSTKFDLHMENF